MHDNIKKFSLAGTLADSSNIVESKERLIFALESQMRDNGVAPSLDLDPQFTLNYRPDSEDYAFELTIYGVKVGIQQSWRMTGISNGKPIMKSTALAK